MKQADVMPCGRRSPRGLSAGVHRKMNVYMLPSNSDCIAPSSASRSSAQHRGRRALAPRMRSGRTCGCSKYP